MLTKVYPLIFILSITGVYNPDWAKRNDEPVKGCVKLYKEEKLNSSEKEYVIAEGFLIYYRKDISDLLDIKFNFIIEKEVARIRRKNTKHYVSDYYFDEYIWRCFNENK